jgi:hypothetical protein
MQAFEIKGKRKAHFILLPRPALFRISFRSVLVPAHNPPSVN